MSICKQGGGGILHLLKGNKVLWKINHHYIKSHSTLIIFICVRVQTPLAVVYLPLPCFNRFRKILGGYWDCGKMAAWSKNLYLGWNWNCEMIILHLWCPARQTQGMELCLQKLSGKEHLRHFIPNRVMLKVRLSSVVWHANIMKCKVLFKNWILFSGGFFFLHQLIML